MAAPRIRLSPIKLAPEPTIVPIVNSAEPLAAAPPAPQPSAVPVPGMDAPTGGTPATDIQVAAVHAAPSADALTLKLTPAPEAGGVGAAQPPAPTAPVAAQPANPAALSASPAADAVDPGSTALLAASAAPSHIRASAVIIKCSAIGAMLLLVAFVAMRFVVPILIEVRKPKVTNPVADKSAPTAVRVIQGTRQVVAKSDANVAYLNELVAETEVKTAAVKPPVPPVAAAVQGPPGQPDLRRYQDAVEHLKVDGVAGGATPRAYIDGRLVKYGEIINRTLGLRFVGVDPEEHVLLFTNGDNETFRKHY